MEYNDFKSISFDEKNPPMDYVNEEDILYKKLILADDKELDEYQLITRLLCDLKGKSKEKYIFERIDCIFVMKSVIHVKGVNKTSLQSYLNKFIPTITYLYNMNIFLKEPNQNDDRDNLVHTNDDFHVESSFKFALNKVLCDWYDNIDKYTNLYDDVTLLNFYYKIRDQLIPIDCLHEVFDSWRSIGIGSEGNYSNFELLNIFYQSINNNSMMLSRDDNNNLKYVEYCFGECLQCFVHNILTYVVFGTIEYDKINDVNFVEIPILPHFLNDLLDKINLAAKINFFRNKLKEDFNLRNNMLMIMNLLAKIFPSKNDITHTTTLNCHISKVPVYFLDDECINIKSDLACLYGNYQYSNQINASGYNSIKIDQLKDHLLIIYDSSSTKFMSYTWNDFKLLQFIRFIKDIILFNKYEVMLEFINEYFYIQTISVGKQRNTNFSYFFRPYFPDIYPYLVIKFTKKRNKFFLTTTHPYTTAQNSNSFTKDDAAAATRCSSFAFSNLDFQLNLPTPFDEIFTNNNIQIYRMIFILNLLLHHTLNHLCDIYWYDNVKKLESKYDIKRIFTLRNFMIKLLNAFSQFWSIHSINILYNSFEHRVQQSKNFDEITQLHNQFCWSLSHIYFIGEEFNIPRKLLMKIFMCMDDFIQFCNDPLLGDNLANDTDEIRTSRDEYIVQTPSLTAIETNFFKSTYLIKHYLSNLDTTYDLEIALLYKEFSEANLYSFTTTTSSG